MNNVCKPKRIDAFLLSVFLHFILCIKRWPIFTCLSLEGFFFSYFSIATQTSVVNHTWYFKQIFHTSLFKRHDGNVSKTKTNCVLCVCVKLVVCIFDSSSVSIRAKKKTGQSIPLVILNIYSVCTRECMWVFSRSSGRCADSGKWTPEDELLVRDLWSPCSSVQRRCCISPQ